MLMPTMSSRRAPRERARRTMVSREGLVFRLALALGATVGATACHHADALNPTFDPSTFFAQLTVVEHAVTLSTTAPFDTVQLHVAATLGDGSTVPVPVTYSASDSTITVDANGHVTAHYLTTSIAYVRASVTYGGVTRRDSVAFQVLSGGLGGSITGVKLELPSGMPPQIPIDYFDNSTGATRGHVQLTGTAVGPSGEPHPEVFVVFTSDDSTIASIDAFGFVSAVHPGYVTLRATASVYGTTYRDSLRLLVGPTLYFGVVVLDTVLPGSSAHITRVAPDTTWIGVEGTVFWSNYTPVAMDINFANTIGVDSASFDPLDGFPATGTGNIPAFGGPYALTTGDFITDFGSVVKARQFSQPGTYPYHSTLTGAHGVIVVCALGDPCYHNQ